MLEFIAKEDSCDGGDQGTFQMKEWGEKPCCEDSGGALKMTRASAKAAFRGGLEGEGATEHVMMYREDRSATFVGLTRFVGRLEEREGSFVLQSSGTFDPATHTQSAIGSLCRIPAPAICRVLPARAASKHPES